jgi:parallel beta-helix repeat protein
VSTYNIIENSEVSNNSWNGIDVGDTGSHHNTIRNNVVFQNGGNYGVDAYAGSDYTIIEDNTVYNNAWIGIAIGWSHHCVIRNNRLHNNTASSVVLDTASHCTVLNNKISYSGHGGITLLGLGTYYNDLLNNTVQFCGTGIDLGACARYTKISGNVFSGNDYGLRIGHNLGYESYGNTVFHNDFIRNGHRAVDNATGISVPNVWDDGYPSGGNYWSDYTGQDVDRDGIGDVPYKIAGTAGSQDRYPLMKPLFAAINAKIDIKPDTLNLKSRGQWITCYIELPKGYSVRDINVSTIRLNNTVSACLKPTIVGDYDGDKITDMMVKFDRAKVINYILSVAGKKTRLGQATLTITGKLKNGMRFEGSDQIKIR